MIARPRRLVASLAVVAMTPLAVTLSHSSSVGADTFGVTTTNDGGPGSLRQAIADANTTPAPNTIVLGDAETYELTCEGGGELRSTNGPLTIVGNGSTIEQTCIDNRVLFHESSERLTVRQTTITGGSTFGPGGGIRALGRVLLIGSTVTANTASQGGGLFAGSNVLLWDSHVDGNTAQGDGGSGLWMDDDGGRVTLVRSTVNDNPTVNGPWAGVYSQGGLVATSSEISGNEADGGVAGVIAFADVFLTATSVEGNKGGSTLGVVVTNGGSAVLIDSMVDNNSTVGPGGGAGIQLNIGDATEAGRLIMVRSSVSGNTAGGAAGVDLRDGTDAVLFDSTVSGNTANSDRLLLAGIGAQAGDIKLFDSTVTLNDAASEQAGVYTETGNVRLTRSTVAGNVAATNFAGAVAGSGSVRATNSTISDNEAMVANAGIVGDDVVLRYVTVAGNESPNASAITAAQLTTFGSVVTSIPPVGTQCVVTSTVSQGYNYEQGSDTCGFGAGPGDVVNGADAQLAALADNGGPTQTRLPADTSPLIDVIPRRTRECFGTDQRGVRRPQDRLCDIGAVEVEQ